MRSVLAADNNDRCFTSSCVIAAGRGGLRAYSRARQALRDKIISYIIVPRINSIVPTSQQHSSVGRQAVS